LNAGLFDKEVPRMNLKKLEKPVNRFGFILFCLSLGLCLIAFLITYRTHYSLDAYWLGHLVLDESHDWQQTVFKFGLVGVAIGSTLAWNYLDNLKRLYKWVRSA
jgi:hypothetical protein